MAVITNARRGLFLAACVAGFTLAVIVYNCIPGWSVPALGQPLWVSTFARSIANQDLLALTSHNTGAPLPSPMSFGLPGAWPMAVLLWLGSPPPAAYGFMCAGWLAVAFAGAIRLATRLGVPPLRAILAATTWLCLPMVWAHAEYSMLSIGFALLPAYLVPVLDATRMDHTPSWRANTLIFGRLACVGIVAAFMDGYSFVMYALASFAIFGASAWFEHAAEGRRAWRGAALQVAALVLAGGCYRLYIGHSHYWVAPVSAFRGWGTDVAFMLQPTAGTSWIADALGLSSERDVDTWFGDRSVWRTTFILPLLVGALYCGLRVTGARGWRLAAACLLLFGTWMAMGPSVKAWSERTSPTVQADGDSHFMPAEAARFATGSEWLATHTPVLDNMRASYRWMALAMLGMWLVLLLAHREGQSPRAALVATWCVLLLAIPPLGNHMRNGHGFVAMWRQVDHDVLKPFRKAVPEGSLVVGVPRENDFLLGYLAARARAVTYNTGGDKNIAMAEPHWPSALRDVPPGQMPKDLSAIAYHLFASGVATVLFVPLYQEPMASHAWPCAEIAQADMPDAIGDMGGSCPLALADQARAQLDAAAASPGLHVWRTASFALILPDTDLRAPLARDAWSARLWPGGVDFPLTPQALSPEQFAHVMLDGWSPVEGDYAWSSDRASLRLPLPATCERDACTLRMVLHTFAATRFHPKDVVISSGDAETHVRSTADDLRAVELALPAGHSLVTLQVKVANARTPANTLPGSTDNRVLGIALYRIEVLPPQ
jgi:hypothetical protein